ncbi:MAG: HAD family hydrolase [Oscillospiraceae bacterium]|nr:HAD family hydrolase [Oscillospiraceae bacterium]
MKYRNCIFDLYGTLVDIHTEEDTPWLWTAMAELYGEQGAVYRPDELRGAYFRAIKCAEAGLASPAGDPHEAHPEIQIELVFQQLFQAKGVPAGREQAIRTGQQFRKLSTEYIRLYDGVEDLLKALRDHGCGVFLLSNAQSIFTTLELEELGLKALFDGIYLSSDYGVKKPDRRFFDLLLKGENLDPCDSVMIGNDGTCDICGGRAAGLSTLYIHSNLSPKEATPQADHVLTRMDLTRVKEILLGYPCEDSEHPTPQSHRGGS